MNPLESLAAMWGTKQFTGVDFGVSHFKVAQLSHCGEGLRLESCGMAEVGLGEDEDTAVRRIRVFLKEHALKLNRVAVNVEHQSLRVRRMDLAKMPDRDLKVAMRWNFREHIDVPIEKYQVAYTKIPVIPVDERLPFMAFGVAIDAVNHTQGRCRKLGLRATTIEPNVSALVAAFDYNVGWQPGAYYALLDLGFHVAHFLIMRDEALFYSRPLAGVTGERFLRLLGREGMVAPEQVRTVLKAALADGVWPTEAAPAVEEFYTNMLVEIQRALDGFTALYHTEQSATHLYVCGGGSALPNLTSHLSKNLGLPTDIFNPFAKIGDTQDQMPAKVEQSALYAVAIGLALPQSRKGKSESE